jgi:hypothetical protein
MKPSFFGAEIPVYNYPVTVKEAVIATYQRKPSGSSPAPNRFFHTEGLSGQCRARIVFDANHMKPEEGGGKDIFGLEWEYIPSAGGSMVRPGKPYLEDANECTISSSGPTSTAGTGKRSEDQ